MLDLLTQLGTGFLHCLTPLNLAMLVIGIVIGLLIGVLPGLTLVMGVALALPFTYRMEVTASIVLLTASFAILVGRTRSAHIFPTSSKRRTGPPIMAMINPSGWKYSERWAPAP